MTTQNGMEWGLAMIRECNDAARLFSRGLYATRAIRFDYDDAVVVMSLLALGAEKMLKLTIGLAHRDRGDPWPSTDDMRRIGHRVRKADRIARPLLDRNAGTAPGVLDGMKSAVHNDRTVDQVLEALDRFGAAGRFHYLDLLAEDPQPGDSPQTLWTTMTTAIALGNPALLADINSKERVHEGRRQLNEEVATTLTRWWELYVAAWRTGAIGKEAQRYAGEVALATV
jgi:hypothetical protein